VALAVGDLTGDGKPEIVTANGVGTATLVVNQGNGQFTRTDLPAGRQPSAVALGDVTGDGKPDIIIANQDSASATLFAGDGAGTFAARIEIPVGIHPSAISIADVTGDGRPDLVIANPNEKRVSLYVGFGDGKFSTPQPITIDHSPIFVAVTDTNGDGKADILTANRDSDTATVITSRPTESQPYQYRVTASDADGDPLTYALVDGPAGMTIDSATGAVVWSPTSSQVGRHNDPPPAAGHPQTPQPPTPPPLPPLLKQLLAEYSATGLPPAYLPKKTPTDQGEAS
jgi:hypothetical protein